MDDEFLTPELNVFSNFSNNKYIRTYSKANRKISNIKDNSNTVNNSTIPVVNNDPLTSKNAVQFLLDGTLKHKVCRYCLNLTSELSELDQYLEVKGQGALYKVTIRDMVASFHPVKVCDDPNFPNKICNKCLDHTISAYLFTQQCERAERALRNCFDDMYDKLEKLDPLERQKRRGRQKANPNYNVLNAEHRNVIDYAEPIINIINTASQSLSEEGPVKDYECLKCCQVLPTVDSLLNHERSHPKSMWYNCRLCGKSFPKKHLLKKHSMQHLLNKPSEPTPNSFVCNRCKDVSTNCNEYLRHIEKHRFKEVMEHLVEKKMDELCSVCLDKSSNMTTLDSMVCLHGGHMDMAGERSLYNILASTIPDPKLYKYQELMIPQKAHIVNIIKKDKQLGNELTKLTLDFSKPIILSTDDIDFGHVYIFFFALPLQEILEIEVDKKSLKINDLPVTESRDIDDYEELKTDLHVPKSQALDSSMVEVNSTKNRSELTDLSKIIESQISDDYVMVLDNADSKSDVSNLPMMLESKALDATNKIGHTEMIPNLPIKTGCDDLKNKSNKAKEINITNVDSNMAEEKVMFTFSKPTYINDEQILHEINQENIIDDTIQPKSCKMCWIFKNKPCEDCKKIQDGVILTDTKNEIETKPCNYCWLFQQVDKCEYCKKPNKLVTDIVENVNTNEFNKSCTKIDSTIETSIGNKSTPQDFYLQANEVKNKPWLCTICLTTNNADRLACFCCEYKVNTNEPLKINFGQYAALFNKSDKSLALQDNIKIAESEENKKIISENMTINVSSDNNLVTVQEMDVELPTHNIIDNREQNYKPPFLEIVKNPFAPEEMDIEDSLIQDSTYMNYPLLSESMQGSTPIAYAVNDTKTAVTPFQFQMGSNTAGDKTTRKFIRPLRKMSRASHK